MPTGRVKLTLTDPAYQLDRAGVTPCSLNTPEGLPPDDRRSTRCAQLAAEAVVPQVSTGIMAAWCIPARQPNCGCCAPLCSMREQSRRSCRAACGAAWTAADHRGHSAAEPAVRGPALG